jgi:uroporphyrinogen decarboxylase
MLKNDRLLRALRREPVDCTPVWLMRQAGRYLPEYRASRARAGSFLAMAKTPELACEVTLQPLRRFPLDAAILFSDILTVPDAMGLGLYFVEGEGPKFQHPLRDAAAVARLGVPDMHSDLGYVMDALRLIRRELDGSVPLIGFSGSPWTLACYMVEGGSSKDFARIKAMALNAPALWGGVLSPTMYREFSLPYLARIAGELERGNGAERVPLILFGKGNGSHLEALAATATDALGIDWTVDIGDAARRLGGKVALQGNLDPATLYGSPAAIRREVGRVLDAYAEGNGGSREGHVFNLGHGMSPDMDPEHAAALVQAVHQCSRR